MKSYKIKIKYNEDGIGKASIHQDSITIPIGEFELTTGIVRQRGRRKALKKTVPDSIYYVDCQDVRSDKIIIPLKRDGICTGYKISNLSPSGVKDGILIDDLAFYTEINLILKKNYIIQVYVNTPFEDEIESPKPPEKKWWQVFN